jgi:hypothetical protein
LEQFNELLSMNFRTLFPFPRFWALYKRQKDAKALNKTIWRQPYYGKYTKSEMHEERVCHAECPMQDRTLEREIGG